MPYTTFTSGSILTAVQMNAITVDPSSTDVTTSQTTTSATYTDLATAGPAVSSVTLVVGQVCTIWLMADAQISNTAAAARMSYAVSGAVTQAAGDVDAIATANVDASTCCKVIVFTCTVAGSHTFTCKYRSNGAATATFTNRRIVVKPH
jgi:hypothetical protein